MGGVFHSAIERDAKIMETLLICEESMLIFFHRNYETDFHSTNEKSCLEFYSCLSVIINLDFGS